MFKKWITEKEKEQYYRFINIAKIVNEIEKLKKDYIACINNLSKEDQKELLKINWNKPLLKI